MWDVLSALIPPAVVAAVFCGAIYALLRREMAPRTSDGRPVEEVESTSRPQGNTAGDDGKDARGPSGEETEHGRDPDAR